MAAVPAIMSTRTIGNWRERLLTIMVIPLTTCSARLPVYTLLIALVIPATGGFGPFNYQGLTLLGLYFLGFFAALVAAGVMRLFIKPRGKSYFVMEMPDYKAPRWGNILTTVLEKVRVFIFDVGKVIVVISIVLLPIIHDLTLLPVFMTTGLAIGVLVLSIAMCRVAALMSLRRLRLADPAELF